MKRYIKHFIQLASINELAKLGAIDLLTETKEKAKIFRKIGFKI